MKSNYIKNLEHMIEQEELEIKNLRNQLKSRLGVLNVLRQDLKNEQIRTKEGRALYE